MNILRSILDWRRRSTCEWMIKERDKRIAELEESYAWLAAQGREMSLEFEAFAYPAKPELPPKFPPSPLGPAQTLLKNVAAQMGLPIEKFKPKDSYLSIPRYDDFLKWLEWARPWLIRVQDDVFCVGEGTDCEDACYYILGELAKGRNTNRFPCGYVVYWDKSKPAPHMVLAVLLNVYGNFKLYELDGLKKPGQGLLRPWAIPASWIIDMGYF